MRYAGVKLRSRIFKLEAIEPPASPVLRATPEQRALGQQLADLYDDPEPRFPEETSRMMAELAAAWNATVDN